MADLTYSGNLMIGGKHGNSLKQNLYSSQSYGTFFTIFGNFKFGPLNEGDEPTLNSVELELINYKGLLDMEFVYDKVEGQKKFRYELEDIDYPANFTSLTGKTKYIYLKLYVRAASFSNDSNTNNAETKFSIRSEDLKKVNFEDNKLLLIERETLSFYKESNSVIKGYSSKNQMNPEKRGIFDEEFYCRNGQIWQRRDKTDKSIFDEYKNTVGIFDASLFNGSPSCHTSAMNIIFIKP